MDEEVVDEADHFPLANYKVFDSTVQLGCMIVPVVIGWIDYLFG